MHKRSVAPEDPSAYPIRVVDDPASIDAAAWNDMLERSAAPTPFMRHEYLAALHASGSACERTGWIPQYLLIEHEGRLVAAAPLVLKLHSYGEYVFDWAWADAYQRHGLRYYPKLLVAVPFTPVPGSRLLARTPDDRRRLLRAMQQLALGSGLSSAHLLFVDDADLEAARAEGWMVRSTVQFHWTRNDAATCTDFGGFLASLQRDKRKKIQQERRRVSEAGIAFRTLRGSGIGEAQWDFFHHCYTLTYQAHHSTPYLTRDFFRRMARDLPDAWLMFVAERAGRPIATSLVAIDAQRRAAFGRYWGATEYVPCLHFEACYYRPLDWCIANGFDRFEGGAQGEHKMARGLLPVQTFSAHWLAHPEFSRAVADYLEREGAGIDQYLDELNERQPYRSSDAREPG
jgi:hypothetical protein